MSRLEAPSEPSMEEILAQIRKIIADEPLQARAEHAHIAAQRRVQAPRPPQPSSTPPEAPYQGPAPALEAIARLESVLNTPLDNSALDDLSDLVEPPAQQPNALASEQTIALEPVHEPAPASVAIEPVAEATVDAPAVAELAVEPLVQEVADIASASDLAPQTETILAVSAPPAEVEPVADAMETALDTLAAGLAAVAVKPSQAPLPVTVSDALPEIAAAPLLAEVHSSHEAEPLPEATASSAVDTVAAVSEPMVEAVADPLPVAVDTPEPSAVLTEFAQSEAESDLTAANDLSKTSPVEPTLATEPATQVEAAGAEFDAGQPAIEIAAAEQVVEASPSAVAAAALPPAPSADAAASSALAVAEIDDVQSNQDDTMADLLRPMLRQWLDENMPRIVERALRVEMAQMRKPKK